MTNKMRPVEVAERLDKQALYPTIWHDGDEEALELAAEIVRKVDKGELAEVVRGRWHGIPLKVENDKYGMNKYNMRIECTNCGFVTSSKVTYAYCPNCGAKMEDLNV